MRIQIIQDIAGGEHLAWHPIRNQLAVDIAGALYLLEPPGEPQRWASHRDPEIRWFGDTLAYVEQNWVHQLMRPGAEAGGGAYRLPDTDPKRKVKELGFAPDGSHVAWIEYRPAHLLPGSTHWVRVGRCVDEEVKLVTEAEFWAEGCLRPVWAPTSKAIAVATTSEIKEWSFDESNLIMLTRWIPQGHGFPALVFHPSGTKVALRDGNLAVSGAVTHDLHVDGGGEVSTGGELIAVGHGATCDLYDLTPRAVGSVRLPAHTSNHRYALSPDGGWLAASMLGRMRLYRIEPELEVAAPTVPNEDPEDDAIMRLEQKLNEILRSISNVSANQTEIAQVLQELLNMASVGDTAKRQWVGSRLTAILDGVLGGAAYDLIKQIVLRIASSP